MRLCALSHFCLKNRATAAAVVSEFLKARTVLTCTLVFLLLPKGSVGQAASGYAVTNFGTGFAGFSSDGPIGLAFDKAGNLFVQGYTSGILYKFGPAGGVASSATRVNQTPISGAPAGLAFSKDGSLFAARQAASDVVQIDPSTGALIRTLVSNIPFATGLATDPVSGDLFVSEPFAGSVARISNFANGPGTVTVYASPGFVDGLSFGPDGTLYAAVSGSVAKIAATNSAMPGAVTHLSVSVPSIDGIAVSSNANTPFIYGNRNDGTITKVDLTTSPPTLTNIFTGGSRGDFVAVGPDGCLYATQSDRVLKVTNADGSCQPPPLGPLFPTNPGPSAFAFSAFCAGLETSEKAPMRFELHSRFMLAANSDGINPVAEAVTLQLGTFSTTIPAGSFAKTKNGRFVFEGEINAVALEVRIASLGNNSFTLKARGKGIDLSAMPKPVTVGLTIGNDTGSTAAFGEEEEGEEGTRDH